MIIVATIAAYALTFIVGLSLVAVSIWGIWISKGFANPSDDQSLGAYESMWVAVRLVLSWLVLFGPFAFAGAFVLHAALKQAFGKQDQSWAYPFRVFMTVVGMRIAAERQTKTKRLRAEGENVLEGTIEPKE
jgi:hypothetical protein